MKNNVVYFLGAGFSAPLGLPVMSNFIEKAKDIYFGNEEGYEYFKRIFSMINELGVLKTYMDINLTNIEDILSLLEMGFTVGQNMKGKEEYVRFIKQTIQHYTPALSTEDITNSLLSQHYGKNWVKTGKNVELHTKYGNFVASLLDISLRNEQSTFGPRYSHLNKSDNTYSIVALNYDNILENIVSYIQKLFPSHTQYALRYAKLHGSINTDIILPSWNKSENSILLGAWKAAYEYMSNANHIRFIGYSMPQTDAYIKYLVGTSLKDTKHFKKVDILCKDPDGSTQLRYRAIFGNYQQFRFKNTSVENYFEFLYPNSYIPVNSDIEMRHHQFMENKN